MTKTWFEPCDVCVVTGGAQGLGAALAKSLYEDYKLKVVSLDVVDPQKTIEGVHYIHCDVRDENSIIAARESIIEQVGKPAVLINNAGIRRGWCGLADAEYSDIDDILRVNLGGAMRATRVFLPDMLETNRGYIVTIASALAMVSPAGLCAYGASKAGLLGFHESLSHEIKKSDVKTMLVCPGQLDTKMFSDISVHASVLAPVLSQLQLGAKVAKRISKGKTSTVYSPAYVRYLPFMRALPTPIAELARKWAGVDGYYEQPPSSDNEDICGSPLSPHELDPQDQDQDQDQGANDGVSNNEAEVKELDQTGKPESPSTSTLVTSSDDQKESEAWQN